MNNINTLSWKGNEEISHLDRIDRIVYFMIPSPFMAKVPSLPTLHASAFNFKILNIDVILSSSLVWLKFMYNISE